MKHEWERREDGIDHGAWADDYTGCSGPQCQVCAARARTGDFWACDGKHHGAKDGVIWNEDDKDSLDSECPGVDQSTYVTIRISYPGADKTYKGRIVLTEGMVVSPNLFDVDVMPSVLTELRANILRIWEAR